MEDISKELRNTYKLLRHTTSKVVRSDMSNDTVVDVCFHIDRAQKQISLANNKIIESS